MEAEAVIERCNPKHLTLLWVWKTLFFLSMELNKGDQSSRYFRKMIALRKPIITITLFLPANAISYY